MATVQLIDVGAGRPTGVVDASPADLNFSSSPSRNGGKVAPSSADVGLVEVAVNNQIAVSIKELDVSISGSKTIRFALTAKSEGVNSNSPFNWDDNVVDVVVVGIDSFDLLIVPVNAESLTIERHAVSVGVVEAESKGDL